MEDMAEFKFWIKLDEKKNCKNEMYSNKHQIILVMICNRIILYYYILYLMCNRITLNNQRE